MSDVVAVALITGGSTGIVGLAGILLSFLNSKKERKQRLSELREQHREWYRHALFDRGMQAAQEALTWERRLRIAVHNVREGTGKVDDVTELRAQACDWFGQNAAYLEYPKKRFSSDFWGLLNSLRRWDGQSNDIDKSLDDLFTFLHNRINWLLAFGGKYEQMNGR